MNISNLNKENILWLYYLANSDEACGLIHNATDKVIWVNNCTNLEVGMTTTPTHIDKNKLITLKQLINELPLVEFKDKNKAFVSYRYKMKSADVIIEVLDRFYKIEIAGEIYRVFEQIEEKLV